MSTCVRICAHTLTFTTVGPDDPIASYSHNRLLLAFLLGEANDDVVGVLFHLSQLCSQLDLAAVQLQMLSQNRLGALLCEVNTVRLCLGAER